MQHVPRPSVSELTASHLREGLRTQRWSGTLPGVARLAKELDVCRKTVRDALRLLEADGVLDSRGLGRSRRIAMPPGADAALRSLRVGILLHDPPQDRCRQSPGVLREIQQTLEHAGHQAFFYHKSQVELRHNVTRISHHLGTTPADALIVSAGSRGLLEWCAEQTLPILALYGRTDGLSLARTGPDKVAAYSAATRELIRLGHRRLVLITLGSRRKPTPGNVEQAFLDELTAKGILTGDYNLPDWEESPKGFVTLLERLFQRTPPTAMILDETPRFFAAAAFLARHRIHVPDQVSLVSTDDDVALTWCHQGFAHMKWNNTPIVHRVKRWVDAVRRGNPDRKIINYPAEFIPGGSIGPAINWISNR